MRWLVFGSGGVGGYVGGRLAAAGESVGFVARGAHLAALRATGLRIRSPEGDLRLTRVEASADPRDLGSPDVVLVAVKSWQLAEAARALAPVLGAGTVVLPLLNGVDAADRLAEACGSQRVLKGLAILVSHISAPGEITHVGARSTIVLGEGDNRRTERVEQVRSRLEGAGIAAVVPGDIDVALWRKFLFVVPFGGVGAVARQPAGVVRAIPELRALMVDAMHEVASVGRARGVAIPADAVEQAMTALDALPADAVASLQRDLLNGRRSELDDWTGAVVRLGQDCGVPTPIHRAIYAALLPLELRARGELL